MRVLEFARDVVCWDPDVGEIGDMHTRRGTATGTDILVIWTFDPDHHVVEIVVPPC